MELADNPPPTRLCFIGLILAYVGILRRFLSAGRAALSLSLSRSMLTVNARGSLLQGTLLNGLVSVESCWGLV